MAWFLVHEILLLLVFPGILGIGNITTEPPVELRWDFTDCGKSGREGPSEEMCNETYKGTNLEGDVKVEYGIQMWTVPISGLFLVTALGPSGAPVAVRNGGKGAELTGEFHMTKGQRIKVLVGQHSDFAGMNREEKPIGGSGGTFVARESDGYILMVAGGGSSGAGTKWDFGSVVADASLSKEGKNASTTRGSFGLGGAEGSGGTQGAIMQQDNSVSGGGAGYGTDGEKGYVKPGTITSPRSPRSAKAFTSGGVGTKAPGVGGYFIYIDDNRLPSQNNGGFGGGGAGSKNGGCGGGGGYSGGGGGPSNGWGGGGGSINNGERQRNAVTNRGKGKVIISFIGHQCCGPVVVYIAMTFIAGVLVTVIIGFIVMKVVRALNNGKSSKTSAKCWDIFGGSKKEEKIPMQ